MPDDPMAAALAGGLILALMTGPLGCFVVWRRMAYFGDAIAHSALIGVALGLWWDLDMRVAILAVSLLFALLLALLRRDPRFSADTLLGVLAHGGLAAGMVLLALTGGGGGADGHELAHEALFGDIMRITARDVAVLAAAAAAMTALLLANWRGLLLMTVHEDIARVEGVRVERMHILLMGMMALSVALAVKMVGILLIASLLVLPAAGARYLAASPAGMALHAAALAMLAVSGGLLAAAQWALPAGPAIVLAAVLLFVVFLSVSALRRS